MIWRNTLGITADVEINDEEDAEEDESQNSSSSSPQLSIKAYFNAITDDDKFNDGLLATALVFAKESVGSLEPSNVTGTWYQVPVNYCLQPLSSVTTTKINLF